MPDGRGNLHRALYRHHWLQDLQVVSGLHFPSEPKFHPFPFVPLAVNLHSFKGNRANLGYTGFDDPEEGEDHVWASYGSYKGAGLT